MIAGTRRIKTKRVYESAECGDGKRVLVDRLWPRGLSRAGARIDLWLKEIAPSTELRRWFAHDPARWAEFKQRYREELDTKHDAVRQLLDEAATGLTLLYSARDDTRNNAAALQEYLERFSAHGKRVPSQSKAA